MIPAKLSATSHTHSSMQPAWLTCDPQALKLYPSLHASAHNPPTHTSCPKTTVFPPAPFPALTLLPHACLLALAQPALLTLATHVHVHLTLAAILADVLCTLDDAATEEALAAFTAQHVVVEAGGLVPTDAAHFISQHLRGWALLPLQGGIFYRNEQYRGKGEGGRKKKKKGHTHEGSMVFAADCPIPYNNQCPHSNPLSPKHMNEKIKSPIPQAPLLGKRIFCNKPTIDIIQTVSPQLYKQI